MQIFSFHSISFYDSLRRRANARNVSFRISLRWPIHIINPVDETKLSYFFLRLFLNSLETWPKKTTPNIEKKLKNPNIEVCPESLRAMLE